MCAIDVLDLVSFHYYFLIMRGDICAFDILDLELSNFFLIPILCMLYCMSNLSLVNFIYQGAI